MFLAILKLDPSSFTHRSFCRSFPSARSKLSLIRVQEILAHVTAVFSLFEFSVLLFYEVVTMPRAYFITKGIFCVLLCVRSHSSQLKKGALFFLSFFLLLLSPIRAFFSPPPLIIWVAFTSPRFARRLEQYKTSTNLHSYLCNVYHCFSS